AGQLVPVLLKVPVRGFPDVIADYPQVRESSSPFLRLLFRASFLGDLAGQGVADVFVLAPRPDADVFLPLEQICHLLMMPVLCFRRPMIFGRMQSIELTS